MKINRGYIISIGKYYWLRLKYILQNQVIINNIKIKNMDSLPQLINALY